MPRRLALSVLAVLAVLGLSQLGLVIAQENSIANGDFEQGAVGWTTEADGKITNTGLPIPSRSGTSAALTQLAAPADGAIGIFSQSGVMLPAAPLTLGFYYQFRTTEAACSANENDGLSVIRVEINAEKIGAIPVCAPDNTRAWKLALYNLAAYAGQTVRLTLRVELVTQDTWVMIDDVGVIDASAPPSATVTTTRSTTATTTRSSTATTTRTATVTTTRTATATTTPSSTATTTRTVDPLGQAVYLPVLVNSVAPTGRYLPSGRLRLDQTTYQSLAGGSGTRGDVELAEDRLDMAVDGVHAHQ